MMTKCNLNSLKRGRINCIVSSLVLFLTSSASETWITLTNSPTSRMMASASDFHPSSSSRNSPALLTLPLEVDIVRDWKVRVERKVSFRVQQRWPKRLVLHRFREELARCGIHATWFQRNYLLSDVSQKPDSAHKVEKKTSYPSKAIFRPRI